MAHNIVSPGPFDRTDPETKDSAGLWPLTDAESFSGFSPGGAAVLFTIVFTTGSKGPLSGTGI